MRDKIVRYVKKDLHLTLMETASIHHFVLNLVEMKIVKVMELVFKWAVLQNVNVTQDLQMMD